MAGVVIVGAGGHGSEVACYVRELEHLGAVELRGFVDDGRPVGPFGLSQVLGPLSVLAADALAGVQYITAIGDNEVRRSLVQRLAVEAPGSQAMAICSPSAWMGEAVEIGEGTCIAPHAVLTTGVRLGRHCIVNVRASVSHDCVVGDFVNINPGVTMCGNVHVADGAYIGAGAVIIERIQIGTNAVVGAGAVVVRDVPAGATVVGVPARLIERRRT